jgi:hypothetical protein
MGPPLRKINYLYDRSLVLEGDGPLLLAGVPASRRALLTLGTLAGSASSWGKAPHKVGRMTRNAGLSPVLTASGKLVNDFIISMILAIFIDCQVYSCLLSLWQTPCIIHFDIKSFPARRCGSSIRETALAIINYNTRSL